MYKSEKPKIAREDVVPEVGRRMIVACEGPGCEHAVLMDPRDTFGAARHWPVAGRSWRFRCRCGHRVAMVSYTRNTSQSVGPLSKAAIQLWF